jgi:hypothetical protein
MSGTVVLSNVSIEKRRRGGNLDLPRFDGKVVFALSIGGKDLKFTYAFKYQGDINAAINAAAQKLAEELTEAASVAKAAILL